MLRPEGSAEHSRCTCLDRPSRSPDEQFRTQGSAHSLEPIEIDIDIAINTAIKRCKSTEFASQQKIVVENRRQMERSLVTQDAAHKRFC